MSRTKLLIVHHRHEKYREAIEARTDEFEIESFDFRDPIPFETSDAEILIGWKFPAGLIERLPKLKWIAAAAAGVDNILNVLSKGSDILVSRARATMPRFMAEYCVQHMLNHVRNYGTVVEQKREATWRHVKSDLLGRYTLGILGLGGIGTEVAITAKAIGMRVLGAKKTERKTPVQDAACDELFTGERWREMLPQCDFLVLLLPSTKFTEHLIGKGEFSLMKSSAVLINIARGSIVDENALLEALQKKTIAGAVLDVFEEEPLPTEHPFWSMDNVVITPHSAGPSEEDAIVEEFLVNFERWRAGGRPDRIVDVERGY